MTACKTIHTNAVSMSQRGSPLSTKSTLSYYDMENFLAYMANSKQVRQMGRVVYLRPQELIHLLTPKNK